MLGKCSSLEVCPSSAQLHYVFQNSLSEYNTIFEIESYWPHRARLP